MIAAFIFAALAIAAALVEIVLPGRALYHAGWYNVLLVAVAAIAIARTRAAFTATTSKQMRAGVVLAVCGSMAAAFAGISCGLLAPDPQTVVGAPGETVRLRELGGSLVFPFAAASGSNDVMLQRGGSALALAPWRISGSFLLRPQPRQVVEIEASDAKDAHLTITQPTGAAFLSPVLMMEASVPIAGMVLPYDAFAVPAAHRTVHAALFTPENAARLRGLAATPGAAVLFEVRDDLGREIPGGVAIAHDGGAARVAGLVLRPRVLTYPAIEIVAIPAPFAVGAGLLAFAVGLTLCLRRASIAQR